MGDVEVVLVGAAGFSVVVRFCVKVLATVRLAVVFIDSGLLAAAAAAELLADDSSLLAESLICLSVIGDFVPVTRSLPAAAGAVLGLAVNVLLVDVVVVVVVLCNKQTNKKINKTSIN